MTVIKYVTFYRNMSANGGKDKMMDTGQFKFTF